MSLSLETFEIPVVVPVAIATDGVDRAKVKSALFHLPAEFYDDRKKWIAEVAIPLKQAGEEFFDLFDLFSQQSHKYQGTDDCRKEWNSLKPKGSKKVGSIFYHAKENGWTWEDTASAPISIAAAEARYPTLTMQELVNSDFKEEYLVEGILIRGVPGIFGGPAKSVKTGQLIDLAYNLSVGGKFLSTFQCTKSKVLVLTGESGGSAIQRRINTLIANAGGLVAAGDHFFISEALPKFKIKEDLDLLALQIKSKEIDVVIIDPAYLCMGGSEASNIQAQGELLGPIGDICRAEGVTLLIAHHFTKTASRSRNKAATLEDLTQAGFDAWARQWYLISRQEDYELGSGVHKLIVSVGNCSSNSAEWCVDIDEGTKDNPKWEVKVSSMAAVRSDARAEKASAQLDIDLACIEALLREPGVTMAQSTIRNKAGISPQRWKVTLPAAIERGVIKEVEGKRGAPHYALAT